MLSSIGHQYLVDKGLANSTPSSNRYTDTTIDYNIRRIINGSKYSRRSSSSDIANQLYDYGFVAVAHYKIPLEGYYALVNAIFNSQVKRQDVDIKLIKSNLIKKIEISNKKCLEVLKK